MHEAAITESLYEQVRSFLPPRSALMSVRVEVGDLEHLSPTAMRTAWSAVTAGTPCEGAVLSIERVPLRVRCRACEGEYDPEDNAILLCPRCGAVRPEVLRGAGVLLRSLEVEEVREEP